MPFGLKAEPRAAEAFPGVVIVCGFSQDWFGCPLTPDVCGSPASATLVSAAETDNAIIDFGIII